MTETAVPAVTGTPRIGDPAPSFAAKTTQGDISFPADYAGEWVILFSHPADFTPVCTSEFMTFATMQDDFSTMNTKLVGLSIDGLYSHIAWLRTIKEKITYRDMTDVEVTFPLIEDITMEIARKYGMIMPGERLHQSRPRGVRHRPARDHPRGDLLPAQPGPQLRRAAPCRHRAANR
jgi:peroxiredoxin (alkyl hydroperoxide reductase subunit C)